MYSTVNKNCIFLSATYADVALDAFYATRDTPSQAANPFIFTSIPINSGRGFDTVSKVQFIPPQSGFYWLFATIVCLGTNPAEFAILSNDLSFPKTTVFRQNTRYRNYDTLSRTFIRYLTTKQTMTSSMRYPTASNGSALAMAVSAWGGFLLNSIMKPLVSHHILLQVIYS